MLYFVYRNICFHWLSLTLKLKSVNISRSSSIINQGLSRTKINFKYFQGLEVGLLKFKGFQGFSRRVRTLIVKVTKKFSKLNIISTSRAALHYVFLAFCFSFICTRITYYNQSPWSLHLLLVLNAHVCYIKYVRSQTIKINSQIEKTQSKYLRIVQSLLLERGLADELRDLKLGNAWNKSSFYI